MLSSRSLYYQESGKVPSIGLLRVLVSGTITAFLGSAMYVFSMNAIAFVGFNILITLIFGVILGFVTGFSAISGKIRNKNAVFATALLNGLLAGYFVWIFTMYLRSTDGLLIFSPIELFYEINALAAKGSFNILGLAPKGATLYLFWAIEAVLIVGLNVIIAVFSFGNTPFCEDCQQWAKATELSARTAYPENLEEFIKALECKDYDLLTNLKNVDFFTAKRLQVEMWDCPNCTDSHHLNISTITTTVVGEKEEKEEMIKTDQETKESTKLIIENLQLSEHAYDQIMYWSNQRNAPPDFMTKAPKA